MAAVPAYPVRVEGRLDPHLSRWLWLVKWLLALPHFIVLAFLWIAFVVLSAVALGAILVTGAYPRSIFDFNVGVLRWTWRVAFYSYSALGTDAYPPFTLGPAPGYPATLDVVYPGRLSRGLALVKWWLLAIPHYLVIGVFGGATAWIAADWGGDRWAWGGGLIELLVVIAAVALLVTGRYPGSIFELVLGLNRWVLRVAAYAGLMTDAYPPFRLDQGGRDPAAVAFDHVPGGDAPPATASGRWGPGRILLVVVGSIAALAGLGMLAAGTAAVAVDHTGRDSSGYVMSPDERFQTRAYAVVSETVDLDLAGASVEPRDWLGRVRIRSESVRPVFVGIARDADAAAYLDGVGRSVVTDIDDGRDGVARPGGAPAGAPGDQPIWAASATGPGTRALTWDVEDGSWTVVLMNADGSRGVDAELAIGAELDDLGGVGVGLLVGGAVVLALAVVAVWMGVARGRRPAGG